MLEDLSRTPEEKRTTQAILHVAVIAFALYTLVELSLGVGVLPLALGAALGLSGVLYARSQKEQWKSVREQRFARIM